MLIIYNMHQSDVYNLLYINKWTMKTWNMMIKISIMNKTMVILTTMVRAAMRKSKKMLYMIQNIELFPNHKFFKEY